MDYQPHHTCESVTSDGGFGILAACPGELSTGATIGISIAVIIGIGAIGYGIWWLVRKRRYG